MPCCGGVAAATALDVGRRSRAQGARYSCVASCSLAPQRGMPSSISATVTVASNSMAEPDVHCGELERRGWDDAPGEMTLASPGYAYDRRSVVRYSV